MAWTERLPSGKYRGCWRDPAGVKCYTRRPEFPQHPYARKRDALEAAQEAEVEARRKAAAQKGTISAKITWSEWWALAETIRTDTDTSNVTRSIVTKHIEPRWGGVALNLIEQPDVKAWVAGLLLAGHEVSYVRTIYGRFRRSLNMAVEAGTLTASPCVGVKLPKVRKRAKTYVDEEHIEVITPNLNPIYKDMVDFGMETGLRPGELCGLHVDAANLGTGWLTVDRVLVGRVGLVRAYPKDEDERFVPLTDTAVGIIRRHLEGRDVKAGCGVPHADGRPCRSVLVFLNTKAEAVTPKAFWSALRRAAAAAEVPNRGPYAVRRGFATRAARGGMDAFELAEIMGHADVRQTQEYVQQTPAARERLRAALGGAPRLTVVRDAG